MGNEWIRRLAEFFNPFLLEKKNQLQSKKSALQDDDEDNNHNGNHSSGELSQHFWFDESERLKAAVYSLSVLYHSLVSDPVNNKHQMMIIENVSNVIFYAAHWIARTGPSEILNPSFGLLAAVVKENKAGSAFISQLTIKLTPNQAGKNIPGDAEVGSLEYGWKPLPNEETKYISFLSLLAERFIYPVKPWHSPHYESESGTDSSLQHILSIPLLQTASVQNVPLTFERACFLLFDQIISIDPSISDLIIQSILAPPPQPIDMMDSSSSQPLEMMKPLGFIVVHSILDVCEKLYHGHQFLPTGGLNNKNQLETVERSIQIFSSIYLHGSQLARELTTAITVNHIKNMKDKQMQQRHLHHDQEVKLLLPYLLASVGKAARLPGGVGYHYIIAVLQLLSVIAFDCERATHQVRSKAYFLFRSYYFSL